MGAGQDSGRMVRGFGRAGQPNSDQPSGSFGSPLARCCGRRLDGAYPRACSQRKVEDEASDLDELLTSTSSETHHLPCCFCCHSRIAERSALFGVSSRCASLRFVIGDVLALSSQPLIASASYVNPSAAMWGSLITSCPPLHQTMSVDLVNQYLKNWTDEVGWRGSIF